jgi:glyoxylase-like metal-dependent hydrolase (beta-lactamase superfamily II)
MAAEVTTIDCEYVLPRFAASYLITDGGRAAFIDNNTAHSVPRLLTALSEKGFKPEQVEYIIITHVHLDHAGGTSALAERCRNATVLAHPRAVKHVIDPSRLVSSARKVYGDAVFEQLYGRIEPVPAERVRSLEDGARVKLGSRELTFMHTRGHANHHFCVLDPASESIFTGDAFGLRYPDIQTQGLFIFPSTSPTDFDPAEAIASVERIARSGAKRAFPTHFGELGELALGAAQLREHLEASRRILEEAKRLPAPPDELGHWCKSQLIRYYEDWLARQGRTFSEEAWRLIEMDLELNGSGIAHVAQKKTDQKEG